MSVQPLGLEFILDDASELQPWLLSNIVDTETSKVPSALQEFQVFERAGVRVGVIGLVEKYDLCFLIYLASFNLPREWITTVPTWPSTFVYKDMRDAGIELSTRLRDPHGEYKCDIIVALTHCR